LVNPGKKEDFFELKLRGVPPNWITIPSPVVRLAPREAQLVRLSIHPPRAIQARLGRYSLSIEASSQTLPNKKEEVQVNLLVGLFVGHGNLGLLISSTQFSATPGVRTDIPLFLVNRSTTDETLKLTVDGLPEEWVKFSTPEVSLAAGEQKGITLSIHPSLAWQSRAGQHTFTLHIASQVNPENAVSVQCTLMVATYTQFRCLVKPPRLMADQPAQIVVSNQGNVAQTYTITWESSGDALAFKPANTQVLRIDPGQVATADFTAAPRRRPKFSDQIEYPYRVLVRPVRGQAHHLNASILGKGVFPIWVLPVALLICLVMAMVPLVAIFVDRLPAPGGTPVAAITQTAAVTQTASANQTAAAIAGGQDSDGDGLNNLQETQLGTNPGNPDTDADSLLDGAEVISFSTNPLNPDTDADTISDGEEVRIGTIPTSADTDRDNLDDGDELRRGTNPKNPDTDADSITDGDEVTRGMDPRNPDTDGDSLLDGDEIRRGTNPLQADTDNDRSNDGNEVRIGTNPLNPDSDGDGILDGLDPDPLNPNNPSLTATALAVSSTNTPVLPTVGPTRTPTLFPTYIAPPTQTPLPPSGMMVFVSDRDGNPEIYSSNLTTNTVQRLTNSPAADTQPSLSADKTRIAFTTNRDGNNEIYLMSQNGDELANLTNNPADDQDPVWSLDGQWVAFASNRDGNWEIYVVHTDGTQLRNLTRTLSNEYQPFWYSERQFFVTNQKIAFTTDRDGNEDIYTMSIDGFNQINLTYSPANDFLPSVSPFGDKIAFVSNRVGNQEIFVMSMNGTNQLNLSNNPSQDTQPVWSADGHWIAFTTDRGGNLEIYLMSSSGTNVSNYTRSAAADTYPSWR
jgi:Tol biopolymer transport system component